MLHAAQLAATLPPELPKELKAMTLTAAAAAVDPEIGKLLPAVKLAA